MVIQLAKALTGVRVIATASREESKQWVKLMGADEIVDHSASDLSEQILSLAPTGIDYAFTAKSAGRIPLFVQVMRPFGEIVAIDNERDLDFLALKDKSLSWHWEFMFTRSRHDRDPEAQHETLEKVAQLIEAGKVRTTLTKTLTPRSAKQIKRAHQIIETGHAIGKTVVADPV